MLQEIEFVYLTPEIDIQQRIADLACWQREWQEEDSYLAERLRQIDTRSRLGEQLADRIATVRTRLEMNLVRKPFGISAEKLQGVTSVNLRESLVRQYTRLSKPEKLLWLNNLSFIMTPNLYEANKKIDRILRETTSRQRRGLLLGGDSRMGKTTYLDFLWCQFRPIVGEERNIVPIVKVEAPASNLGPRTLPQRMVLEFGLNYSVVDNEERLSQKVRAYMQICETKVCVIDEVENIRTKLMQRKLIELWNSFPKVLIICASCRPEVFASGDDQIENRWDIRHDLKTYDTDGITNLLTFVEMMLPFTSASKLYNKSIVSFIEQKTGGNLWKIMNLLTETSKIAINSDRSCITKEFLEIVWDEIRG
jgi:hypothetical protein